MIGSQLYCRPPCASVGGLALGSPPFQLGPVCVSLYSAYSQLSPAREACGFTNTSTRAFFASCNDCAHHKTPPCSRLTRICSVQVWHSNFKPIYLLYRPLRRWGSPSFAALFPLYCISLCCDRWFCVYFLYCVLMYLAASCPFICLPICCKFSFWHGQAPSTFVGGQ